MIPIPRPIQRNTNSTPKCLTVFVSNSCASCHTARKLRWRMTHKLDSQWKDDRWTSVANVWKLRRITVYSSLNGPPPVPAHADLSSTAASAVASAAAAVASSPEDSDVRTFTDDAAASAAAAAVGWSSCTGFSVSAAGRMFGTDNAVDDGWNLP